MKHAFTIIWLLVASSNVFCVTVTLSVQPARCGLNNGSANAIVTGGIPPYSVSWSNGSTAAYITDLAPGDYTVTVTDGLGNTDQDVATIVSVWQLADPGPGFMVQPDCMGLCTGMVQYDTGGLMGTEPYTYGPFGTPITGQVFMVPGVCAFPTIVPVTDANGCSVDLNPVVAAVQPGTVEVLSTSPSCPGGNAGSITFLLSGWASDVHVSGPGGTVYTYPNVGVPYVVEDLQPGNYTLTSTIPQIFGCTGIPVAAAVGALSQDCGTVSGTLFIDADQDCALDAIEARLPFRVITIEPGSQFAISDGNGVFSRNLDLGNYTVAQPLVNEEQLCPAQHPVPVTLDAVTPTVDLLLADSSFTQLDLAASMHVSAMRPGFPFSAYASVYNLSPYPSGAVTVTVSYDASLDPVSVGSNGTAVWNLPPLGPYTYVNVMLNGALPPDIGLLGQVYTFTTSVSNTLGDANPTNDSSSLARTVTGSYDPNDKQGLTSSGLSDTQYFLNEDAWIDYTIRFQNTGTAAAETVTIRDTMDTDLLLPSLEILSASHAFTPSFGQGRELIFTFNNIDLPDSLTDLLGSQGFISYRIKPNSDVVVGTLLDNTAGIYFDFNPPIITNTVSHVVDFSTEVRTQHLDRILLQPNPVSDQLWVSSDGSIDAITIQAADGREILHRRLRATSSTIDVSGLHTGAYFLVATMNNGSVVRERFIKQ